jgi:hypothetical protein
MYADGTARTVTLPSSTVDGTQLKFAGGINEFTVEPGSEYLVSITLSAFTFQDEFDETQVGQIGLVTISPGFV